MVETAPKTDKVVFLCLSESNESILFIYDFRRKKEWGKVQNG
jgi:hypothetical protein